MIDQDFPSLTRLATESRLGRTIADLAHRVSSAWQDSRSGGVLRRGALTFGAWPVRERVRVAGSIAGWAAIGHWGLLFVVPPYVAPGIPGSVVLAIGVLGFLFAAAAEHLADAWPGSAIRRVTRWLTS